MAIPLLPASGDISPGANVPVVYGIANCDTVKKARRWLDDNGTAYRFHDIKRHGLPADRLMVWIDVLGLEALVNRRGTTWRGLNAVEQAALQSVTDAPAALLRHPSTIKRPVVEWPAPAGSNAAPALTVGFNPGAWWAKAAAAAVTSGQSVARPPSPTKLYGALPRTDRSSHASNKLFDGSGVMHRLKGRS